MFLNPYGWRVYAVPPRLAGEPSFLAGSLLAGAYGWGMLWLWFASIPLAALAVWVWSHHSPIRKLRELNRIKAEFRQYGEPVDLRAYPFYRNIIRETHVLDRSTDLVGILVIVWPALVVITGGTGGFQHGAGLAPFAAYFLAIAWLYVASQISKLYELADSHVQARLDDFAREYLEHEDSRKDASAEPLQATG